MRKISRKRAEKERETGREREREREKDREKKRDARDGRRRNFNTVSCSFVNRIPSQTRQKLSIYFTLRQIPHTTRLKFL